MSYCSQEDLENALGVNIILSAYDDDNDGEVDEGPLEACLEYGTAQCNSFLYGQYAGPYPIDPVPDELKFAAVDFCCAYTARRRAELGQSQRAESWKDFDQRAREQMERYVKSVQRLPASAGTPAGITGSVSTGTGVVDEDGRPVRVWDDMGDF